MLNALIALLLSTAMFAPTQGGMPSPIQSPGSNEAFDRAVAAAKATAPAMDSRVPAVSGDARRHPEELARFIQGGMNEPVPIATHDRYYGMHNLLFQKKEVILDAGIGYNTATGMIDIVDGNGEVLYRELSFKWFSIFWLLAVVILILPVLNPAYETGQKLGTVWGAAMIPTILAAGNCFVTFLCAEAVANKGYLVATVLMAFAITCGATARAAAEKYEAAWPYASTYVVLMLAALIAFVVPY